MVYNKQAEKVQSNLKRERGLLLAEREIKKRSHYCPRRRKVRLAPLPPAAKAAHTPLLLLSPRNPLRWARAGTPYLIEMTALRAAPSSMGPRGLAVSKEIHV